MFEEDIGSGFNLYAGILHQSGENIRLISVRQIIHTYDKISINYHRIRDHFEDLDMGDNEERETMTATEDDPDWNFKPNWNGFSIRGLFRQDYLNERVKSGFRKIKRRLIKEIWQRT